MISVFFTNFTIFLDVAGEIPGCRIDEFSEAQGNSLSVLRLETQKPRAAAEFLRWIRIEFMGFQWDF